MGLVWRVLLLANYLEKSITLQGLVENEQTKVRWKEDNERYRVVSKSTSRGYTVKSYLVTYELW